MNEPTPQGLAEMFDTDAEKSVLGAMIIDAAARSIAQEMLTAADFYRPEFGELFEAMDAMDRADKPVDAILLVGELTSRGRLEGVGGREAIYNLMDGVPSTYNTKHYAGEVLRHSVRRKAVMVAHQIISMAATPKAEISQLMDDAQGALLNIDPRLKGTGGLDADIAVAVDAALVEADKIQKQNGTAGLPTGLTEFDRFTGGFRRGENVVIAGATGAGKSAFLIGAAIHSAMTGHPAILLSAEMPFAQVGKRILQSDACVWGSQIRNGTLREQDWSELRASRERLAHLPLHIVGRALTVPDIGPVIRRCSAKWRQPVELVAIDYLQILRPHSRGSRYEVVSEMSRAVKALAMEHQVAVMTVSQLTRSGVKQNPGSQEILPTIHDLKETGSLENDADFVLLMYAPMGGKQICEHDQRANEVWLRVGKGRETGTTPWPMDRGVVSPDGIRLRWYPGWTLLRNWYDSE